MLALVMREEMRLKQAIAPRGTVEAVWDGRNRRRHPRHQLSCPVQYRLYPSETEDTATRARAWDTGAGGVAVRLPERLAPGAWLELDILAEPGATVRAQGEVRWTRELPRAHPLKPREFLTGLQFLNITPEAVARLIACAQQHKESA